jgi:predicted kinase
MGAVDLVVVTGWPAAGKSTVAEALGVALPGTVISFDWVMSGLRSFPDVWATVEASPEHQREVGWTLMGRIAELQFRIGASVVMDLVARDASLALWQALADRYDAKVCVIECVCEDEDLHRQRVEGRDRGIPGWYELTWEQVRRTRDGYLPLSSPDKLVLDAAVPPELSLQRALDHVAGR